MIQYLNGDATRPSGVGSKILVHVCNTSGGWGSGFVLAVSKRWRAPEDEYRRWFRSGSLLAHGKFQLGAVQYVAVEPNLLVCNMIAQNGYAYMLPTGQIPLDYGALETCLHNVASNALLTGSSVHMPRIGCSLAGGSWGKVVPLIQQTLRDVDVFVYDIPNGSFNP